MSILELNKPVTSIEQAQTLILKYLVVPVCKNLNSAIIRQSWFINSELRKAIFELTSVLKSTTTFAGRIHSILAGLPICKVCNNRPIAYYNGMLKTCGEHECKQTTITTNRINTLFKLYGKGASPKTIAAAKDRVNQLQIKGRATLLKRHGVVSPSQLSHVKLAISSANKMRKELNKLKPDRLFNVLNRYQNKLNSVTLLSIEETETSEFSLDKVTYNCNTCQSQETRTIGALKYRELLTGTACATCSGIKLGSYEQMKLYNDIKKLEPLALINERTIIKPLEIDIYIPNKQLGIEYNGIYWHSDDHMSEIAIYKHQTKHLRAKATGLKLLQLSSTWSQELSWSLVIHALGMSTRVGARTCKADIIDNKIAISYMKKWHTAGCIDKFDMAYQLKLGNKTMLIATIYEDKPGVFVVRQLAGRLGVAVVGGISKLITHIKRQLKVHSLIVYCDAMVGGTSLLQSGGKLLGLSEPFCWHVNIITNKMIPACDILQPNWRIYYDAGVYEFLF